MIDPLHGYGSKVLKGISRYLHQQPKWRIAYFDRGRRELVELIRNFDGDGIICTALDESYLEAARQLDFPVVNVVGTNLAPGLVHVVGDDAASGAMAAKYLLERGFKSFGFVVREGQGAFAAERAKGFAEQIEAAGFGAPCFELKEGGDQDLQSWLSKLPRPLAISASNDIQLSAVGEACYRLGLKVPEEVALLGIGNHEQLCELSSPSLSSVEVGMERRGYEAARLLDRILNGEPAPAEPMRIPPVRVVERQSAQFYAFDDPEVISALKFIWAHASETIHVANVVAATNISRRGLEGRFSRLVGRTLHEEIWRAHFDLAMRLLSSSDLPLKEVAQRSGFRTASALVSLFQAKMGMTPKEYRIGNRL